MERSTSHATSGAAATMSPAGGGSRTSSRSTPYPHPRRSSAPSVPSLAPLSPLVSAAQRPSLRMSNTSTAAIPSRDSAAATQPVILHGSHPQQVNTGSQNSSSNSVQAITNTATTTTTGSSLPTILSSSSSIPSSIPSPFMSATSRHSISTSNSHNLSYASAGASGGGSTNSLSTLAMASSTLPSSIYHGTSFINDTASTNQYIEHWQVVSKESAKQINDLSLLMSMDQSTVVTFHPHSYTLVKDAEVGQHNWFRAQSCTCETYRGGFDRVRRPATIRDHLAKQACAPPSLARLAELQLRMMRTSSKRLSHASVSDISNSPKLPSLAEYQQRQSTPSGYAASPHPLPSLLHHSGEAMQRSASEMAFPPLGYPSALGALHHPASPSWVPLQSQMASSLHTHPSQNYHQSQGTFGFQGCPMNQPDTSQDSLEMSRSWPTSAYHDGVSSPFFGWSTDSEHAPSSASMSTNNSDLGSASSAGLGIGFTGLTMSQCPVPPSPRQQPPPPVPTNYKAQHYTLGSALYGGPGLHSNAPSMAGGPQTMFSPSPKDQHNSDSPLFGHESESLFTFDDM